MRSSPKQESEEVSCQCLWSKKTTYRMFVHFNRQSVVKHGGVFSCKGTVAGVIHLQSFTLPHILETFDWDCKPSLTTFRSPLEVLLVYLVPSNPDLTHDSSLVSLGLGRVPFFYRGSWVQMLMCNTRVDQSELLVSYEDMLSQYHFKRKFYPHAWSCREFFLQVGFPWIHLNQVQDF